MLVGWLTVGNPISLGKICSCCQLLAVHTAVLPVMVITHLQAAAQARAVWGMYLTWSLSLV